MSKKSPGKKPVKTPVEAPPFNGYEVRPNAKHVVNAAVQLEAALRAVPDNIAPPVWDLIYSSLEEVKQQRQRVIDHFQLAETVQHGGSNPWPGPWPPPPIAPEPLDALEAATSRLRKYVDLFAAINPDHPLNERLKVVVACAANLAEQIRDWFPIAPPPESPAATEKPNASNKPPMTPDQRLVFDLLNSLPVGEARTGSEIIGALKEEKEIEQSTLTSRIIPFLQEHYGVNCKRGAGYYVEKPA